MKRSFSVALNNAQILREKCLEMLENVPDFCIKENHIELGHFICKFNTGCLDFWRKGNEKKKTARLTAPNRSININSSLCVFTPNHRVILTDFAGISIEEHFNEDDGYPHTEFKWGGYLGGSNPLGNLAFIRVDLSGQKFVNYEIDDNYKARANGRYNAKPETGTAPLSIKDGDDFFGVKVRTNIDFEARANEILEESELIEFASECKTFSI